jgi:hypothetical protein
VNADFLDLPAQERRPRERRAERTTETDT